MDSMIEEKEGPNTLIVCNKCGEKITSCCMMSPDQSLAPQFEGAMIMMRKHFKDEHGMLKHHCGKCGKKFDCGNDICNNICGLRCQKCDYNAS